MGVDCSIFSVEDKTYLWMGRLYQFKHWDTTFSEDEEEDEICYERASDLFYRLTDPKEGLNKEETIEFLNINRAVRIKDIQDDMEYWLEARPKKKDQKETRKDFNEELEGWNKWQDEILEFVEKSSSDRFFVLDDCREDYDKFEKGYRDAKPEELAMERG